MIENLISYKDLFMQLITAGVGGFITMSTVYIVNHYRNKKFEYKYKVSGNYITQYEDEYDGNRVKKKAPLLLKQKGTKINGVTNFENRVWLLDGNISDDGYIYGRYYAENKHDKGVGNFFYGLIAMGICMVCGLVMTRQYKNKLRNI